MRGVILDLRINGGGALNAAIGITALFAGRDRTAMVTVERGDANRRRYTTNWPDYALPVMHGQDPLAPLQADDWWRTVPLVVLVDGQSASAAEATAAALKDLGRAKLLGMPTYGKGLAQTGVDLIDGTRLNFTYARNLRPNGCPMDGYGVVPDWLVPPRRDSDVDGVLLWYREADLARAPYADRLAPDPFAKVRKERQKLREQRALAKIDTAKSGAAAARVRHGHRLAARSGAGGARRAPGADRRSQTAVDARPTRVRASRQLTLAARPVTGTRTACAARPAPRGSARPRTSGRSSARSSFRSP